MKEAKNIFDILTVTSCAVYPVSDNGKGGKTKAIARAVLNKQLQLTGLRVIEGANGHFVAYPFDKEKAKAKDYSSIFYPLCKELRKHIEDTLLEEYQRVVAKQGGEK